MTTKIKYSTSFLSSLNDEYSLYLKEARDVGMKRPWRFERWAWMKYRIKFLGYLHMEIYDPVYLTYMKIKHSDIEVVQ